MERPHSGSARARVHEAMAGRSPTTSIFEIVDSDVDHNNTIIRITKINQR